jgi:hypothetical protein
MGTLLRKAGIVDDQRGDLGQFLIKRARQARKQHVGIPRAHDHTLLQPLPHRLDLICAVDQPRGDRLDALPLPVQ